MTGSMLFLALALLSFIGLSLCQEYYVRPSALETCNDDPCMTLEEYARNASSFRGNQTFIFMEGDHFLNSSLYLSHINNVSLTGEGKARIVMQSNASILVMNVGDSKLESVEIYYETSGDDKAALDIREASFDISSVQFIGQGQFARALIAQLCTVVVINCTFTNGHGDIGGAVQIFRALFTFYGNNTFINNTAETAGAAVHVNQGDVFFNGTNRFIGNSGNTGKSVDTMTGGGAIFVTSSTVNISGVSIFEENGKELASGTLLPGGSINVFAATVNIDGKVVFKNNIGSQINTRPTFHAGAISAHMALVSLKGTAVFSGNHETGAISLFDSTMVCYGEVTFINNEVTVTEQFGGAAIFAENSSVSITGNMNFTNNFAFGVGGAIYMFNATADWEGNVTFMNNTCIMTSIGGGAFVDLTLWNLSGNVNFTNNTADIRGGGIYALDSTLELFGYITFENNSANKGGAMGLEGAAKVCLSGNVNLTNNTAHFRGGGIYAHDSTLELFGFVTFENNSAVEGGAMGLEGITNIVLQSSVKVDFIHNHADFIGGGILFIDANTFTQCQNISMEFSDCFFMIKTNDNADIDVQINFINNTANKAGTVLYGGALELCRVRVDNEQIEDDTIMFLSGITNLTTDENGQSQITSDPLMICFCDENGEYNCSNDTIQELQTQQGREFNVTVISVGQLNGPVPSTIRAFISNNENNTSVSPQSHEIETTCSEVSFQMSTDTDSLNRTLVLFPDGPCGNTANTRRSITIILDPCSPGFEVRDGRCDCERRLKELDQAISCNVDTGLIQRPGNSWVAPLYDDNEIYQGFLLNPNCPFTYCKTADESIMLNFSSSEDADQQCSSNHTGMVCGACRPGFSLQLRTLNCDTCSNRYLSLAIFFSFAGVALVVILLVLQVTVSAGTINGLILYANIVNANNSLFNSNFDTNVLTIFIAWLNLDFGIEACFYDNIDAYAYAWLQYVFPFYLWFLIALIIFINRLPLKVNRLFGSNPVAVLATILLMSYAKLLQNTIIALSFTTLEFPDGSTKRVWKYDGNVMYFEGRHAILAIGAILVVIFLILPFTFLLIFGYRLQAWSDRKAFKWFNRFKPLLDAYYGPYNTQSRHWPGLMLLVRIVLYLTFSSSIDGINLTAILTVMSVVAIIPWLSKRLYENFYNDILEASFVFNLLILTTATYHVRFIGGKQLIATYLSIGVAFIEFLGIMVFHTYKFRIKNTTIWKRIITSRHIKKFAARLHVCGQEEEAQEEPKQLKTRASTTVLTINVYDDSNKLRESFLEPTPSK